MEIMDVYGNENSNLQGMMGNLYEKPLNYKSLYVDKISQAHTLWISSQTWSPLVTLATG